MKPHLKLVFLACLAMVGAWMAVAWAQDSMADFGLKVDELEESVVDAVVNGYVPTYPDKNLFKAAPRSVQAALVRNTLSWFKTYTESDAFRSDYAQQRSAAKPSAPQSAGVDEQYAAYLAEQRQSIESMKAEISKMPPELQKEMENTLKQIQAEFEKSAQDQNMAAMVKDGLGQQIVSEQQAYQERLADWEKHYPEDPTVLIAARLRQFMDVSGSIDFDAQLVKDTNGDLMKFVDPQYEAQTRQWKLCYRAGREPVQAARAFVGEWLNQLEKN